VKRAAEPVVRGCPWQVPLGSAVLQVNHEVIRTEEGKGPAMDLLRNGAHASPGLPLSSPLVHPRTSAHACAAVRWRARRVPCARVCACMGSDAHTSARCVRDAAALQRAANEATFTFALP
jgi:hypothetical protein